MLVFVALGLVDAQQRGEVVLEGAAGAAVVAVVLGFRPATGTVVVLGDAGAIIAPGRCRLSGGADAIEAPDMRLPGLSGCGAEPADDHSGEADSTLEGIADLRLRHGCSLSATSVVKFGLASHPPPERAKLAGAS